MRIKDIAFLQTLYCGDGTPHRKASLNEKHLQGFEKRAFIVNDENSFDIHVSPR
jgi:hypothetical protein